MRRILVTGASGFLGHFVVKELLKNHEFEIVAIGGRPEDKANPLPESSKLRLYTLDKLFTEKFDDVDTVINCAFARSNDYCLLSEALDFTSRLINRLRVIMACSVINISTQGVYKRQSNGALANETSSIEPMDNYSLAKYASENMFVAGGLPYVTNVRMSSINMPQRFLNFFVQKVKKNETITITKPKQPASLIDVCDAATALGLLTNIEPSQRANTYNLGIGYQMTILDYAQSVIEIGELLGYKGSLVVENNEESIGAGMDCSLIMSHCNWSPQISNKEMIQNMFMA